MGLELVMFYDNDFDGDSLVPFQAQVENWKEWRTAWNNLADVIREMKDAFWDVHKGAKKKDTPQIVANVRPKKSRGKHHHTLLQLLTKSGGQPYPMDDGEGLVMP